MKTKRRLTIVGIIIGVLLTLAPVFGLLGTVFGMTRAFSMLGGSGIEDPKGLSDSIGLTLVSTAAGLFFSPSASSFLRSCSCSTFGSKQASGPPPLRQKCLQ